MVQVDYFIPYVSVLLAITMVFVVVFITMLYTTRKIRRNNVIEELRIENILVSLLEGTLVPSFQMKRTLDISNVLKGYSERH